jgi:hypothetical protein
MLNANLDWMSEPMEAKKPYVFIGSSKEGHPVAEAIQQNLEFCSEPQIWSQGGFGLSGGTLESLVKKLDEIDFAVLVLTPDDIVESRGEARPAPRDNVLFELGLFVGGLGRERTFMVCDRSVELKLPSDLAGITRATYEPPQSRTWQGAVGAACTAIKDEIAYVGRRKDLGYRIAIDASPYFIAQTLPQPILHSGILLTVRNVGKKTLPPYRLVFVIGSSTTNFFQSEQSGEQLPQQQREYRSVVFDNNKPVPHWAGFLHRNTLAQDLEKINCVLRLTMEHSTVVLYESTKLGIGIMKAVAQALRTGTSSFDIDHIEELRPPYD